MCLGVYHASRPRHYRRSRTLEHSGLSMGAGRLKDKRGPRGLAFLFFSVSVVGSIYPSLWGISCSEKEKRGYSGVWVRRGRYTDLTGDIRYRV